MQKGKERVYRKGDRVVAVVAGTWTTGTGTVKAGPGEKGLYAVVFDEHGLRDGCRVLGRAEP